MQAKLTQSIPGALKLPIFARISRHQFQPRVLRIPAELVIRDIAAAVALVRAALAGILM